MSTHHQAPAKARHLISHKQPHSFPPLSFNPPQATMPSVRQPSPSSPSANPSVSSHSPLALEHTNSSSSSSSGSSFSSTQASSSSECEGLASPLRRLSLSDDEYRSRDPLRTRKPGAESFLLSMSHERTNGIRKTTQEDMMDKEHRQKQRRMHGDIDTEGEHSHTTVVALWSRLVWIRSEDGGIPTM